jgi:hypothetical protein
MQNDSPDVTDQIEEREFCSDWPIYLLLTINEAVGSSESHTEDD